jgi:glycosyltransferase involved in cell wall biosynthesis
MAFYPKISVVTPSYNQGEFLLETMLSVFKQYYPNLEYIVIDGGSTDDSVEIIKSFEDKLAYWVSEPDKGQAHAINKGFERASGDILYWINSDDILLPGALTKVAETFEPKDPSLILGDVIHFSRSEWYAFNIRQHNITLHNLIKYWKRDWMWNQPGTFISRESWQITGPLDESLTYVFDRDWMCRCLLNDVHLICLDRPVAAFRLHAGSKTVAGYTLWSREQKEVTFRYLGTVNEILEDEVEIAQKLMNASMRLSLQHIYHFNKWEAAAEILAALKLDPQLLLSQEFWRLMPRLLTPLGIMKKIRPLWLRKRSESELMERANWIVDGPGSGG